MAHNIGPILHGEVTTSIGWLELEARSWIIIRVSADLLRNRPDVVIARVRRALLAAGCPI